VGVRVEPQGRVEALDERHRAGVGEFDGAQAEEPLGAHRSLRCTSSTNAPTTAEHSAPS
jgi:hypothetical protein